MGDFYGFDNPTKGTRERKKAETGNKVEGRKSYLEKNSQLVRQIKQLRRFNLLTKKRIRFQNIAEELGTLAINRRRVAGSLPSRCSCKQSASIVHLEPSQVTPFLFPLVPRLPLLFPLHLFFRRYHRIRNIKKLTQFSIGNYVDWMPLGIYEDAPAIALSFRPCHQLQALVAVIVNNVSQKDDHHSRFRYSHLIIFSAHYGTT